MLGVVEEFETKKPGAGPLSGGSGMGKATLS